MVMENIVFLLNNFLRCSAYDHVIFCWVLHRREILEEMLPRLATGDCQVRAVSLVCTEEALSRRLEADIRAGLRQGDALERSLSYLPLYARLDTEKLDVSCLTPEEAAARLEEMGCGV